MAAKSFTSKEWKAIGKALDKDPERFDLPGRVYGSVLLASFNIRKLGSSRGRNQDTWEFLADVCSHFDLLAVQEIMDDLSGLKRLMSLLGPDFGLIVSDTTGRFPGSRGVGERLGFIYNRRVVERTEVATDITYDRTKMLETLARKRGKIYPVVTKYGKYLESVEAWEKGGKVGSKPKKSRVQLPVFLSFIRQPFCVSFRIHGHTGTEPYEFMAINAHLFYGNPKWDPKLEFDALMEWIIARARQHDRAYYPNFVLLGDLNLDFDRPENDRKKIETHMKTFDTASGEEVDVDFPFLDVHPKQSEVFRTNARMSETFDQIGLFSRDTRLPTYWDNATMGQKPTGPDYGVFNFSNLFAEVLEGKPFDDLSKARQRSLLARFEHKVSDHMPLWLRLPLP